MITVSCYIATLWFKNTGSNFYWTFLAGIGNTLVISVINFIYVKLIFYFTNKVENHKYLATLEESQVIKIFVFSLINSNIGLCYTAFYWWNFSDLFWSLFGMMFTKIVNSSLNSLFIPWFTFWIKKQFYFWKVHKLAQE